MLYADDTQDYKSFDLDDYLSSILCVEKCVSDVKARMMSNKFQMNEDKADVLLVTAKRIVNLQNLPEFMNINLYLYCDCYLLNLMSINIVKRLELF